MEWQQIEDSWEHMREVEGGFSPAQRGLIPLEDGRVVFAKSGVTPMTRDWAKKEILAYDFLEKKSYPHSPRLIAVSPDETGFAIEAYRAEDGWDWRNTWPQERLEATLQAMEDLASIAPTAQEQALFNNRSVGPDDNGWLPLLYSRTKQTQLLQALEKADAMDVARRLHFEQEAATSSQYTFTVDTLVHQDVRADNCAWNARQRTVRLVDWNWLQYGDQNIDMAATLAHVAQSGCDISKDVLAKTTPDALHWVAGYWCHVATTPIWEKGPAHLRNMQLHAGVAALRLMARF